MRTYIDDVLWITASVFEDHPEKLDKVLKKKSNYRSQDQPKGIFLYAARVRISRLFDNQRKYHAKSLEGPSNKKIAVPTKKKQLRSFIGMTNYYRNTWIRRSDILAPLANITSKEAKWKSTEEHQNDFDIIKRIVS